MPSHKKLNSSKDRKPRRAQTVPLNPDEVRALIRIWRDDATGRRAFAKRMAGIERPDDVDNHTENILKNLYRIEDGDQGITQWRFETIAEVLGKTADELKMQLSAPTPDTSHLNPLGPWITDEKVLAEYRRVYYGYYITKQGDDYFWMHHSIDFSAPYKGCLYAIKNYGIDRPIYYKVYAYVFRQMLVAITQSDEEQNQLESVAIYHDFRRPIREHVGHFGIRVNEDWNGYFGLGASIMLQQPLEGTEKEGRQSRAMCEKLTQYWKDLDGERCNRLLHLFGFGPYSRSANVAKKQDSVRVSKRQARASKKK